MGKFDNKHTREQVLSIWQILLRGISRTMLGAIIATLFTVSVYEFTVVNGADAYVAAADVIATLCTLTMAICGVYAMGRKKWAKK